MLSTAFNNIIDVLIDRIIAFSDYFIIKEHLSLSEGFLFGLCAIRGFWPLLIGSASLYDNRFIATPIIAAVIAALSVGHLIALFFSAIKIRIAVICMYGFVWGFLGILFAMTNPSSISVPIFAVNALLSAFIAVRLIRERNPNIIPS